MAQEQEKVPGFHERLRRVIAEKFDGTGRTLAIALGRVAEGLPREAVAGTSRREQAQERADNGVRAKQYSPYVSRWLKGGLPDAERLLLLRKATGDAVDWWLLGDQEKRYPWEPAAWTPEHYREFVTFSLTSSALQIMKERAEDIELLKTLADSAQDDAGRLDYDTENDVLGEVERHSTDWLGKMHQSVREIVDREIDRRLALHAGRVLRLPVAPRAKVRKPAPRKRRK